MADEQQTKAKPEFYDSFPTPPAQSGWFPVLICWDSSEGFLPSARQALAGAWVVDTDPVTHVWPTPFDTRDAALDYAYDNDPDW